MNEKSLICLGASGVFMAFAAGLVATAFVFGAPGWFGPWVPSAPQLKKEEIQ